jgi:hypothetical protein
MTRSKALVLALALLLAACTKTSTGGGSLNFGSVYWTYYDTSYTPISDIAIAGGSGQLLTQVVGNPFGVTQDQFDAAVTSAMYGAHFGPATHFTTTPTGSYRRLFFVRMVFDSVYPMTINTICTAPPQGAPPHPVAGPVSLRISAAFCQEDRVLSYLEGGGSGYTGPDDPRFVEFIQEVTFNLFPPNNSTLRRGQPGNCQWPGC